jgi:hypothetical protein
MRDFAEDSILLPYDTVFTNKFIMFVWLEHAAPI